MPRPLGLRLPENSRVDSPLEDTEPRDSDRHIDSCSFRREQFDIFKNQYREAFDEYGHEKLANLTLDPALKKDIVNTLRKLQRAKFALEREAATELSGLIQKIDEIYEELSSASKGDTEFTANSIPLPEYDDMAVELFFGNEDVEHKDALTTLRDFNKIFAEKITSIIGAAQVLLSEYEEFKNLRA